MKLQMKYVYLMTLHILVYFYDNPSRLRLEAAECLSETDIMETLLCVTWSFRTNHTKEQNNKEHGLQGTSFSEKHIFVNAIKEAKVYSM
jgi:hypothetical protein